MKKMLVLLAAFAWASAAHAETYTSGGNINQPTALKDSKGRLTIKVIDSETEKSFSNLTLNVSVTNASAVCLTVGAEVTVSLSVLPTGASTSDNQVLLRGDVTTTATSAGLQRTAGNASLAIIAGSVTTTAATAANQTTTLAALNKLTWVASCESAIRYQSHYIAASWTSTTSFVLCSPTTASKRIRVLALHQYTVQGTASGGAIVQNAVYDSASGVTLNVSAQFLPGTANAAEQLTEVDSDDTGMWGPCGWPLSVGSYLSANFLTAMTGGRWLFHIVWIEE